VQALLGFARQCGIKPIKATVHPANEVSIRLLRSAGFRRTVGSADEDARAHVYCHSA
jgi:RimJ/RimL family protein N-acetyltransferase